MPPGVLGGVLGGFPVIPPGVLSGFPTIPLGVSGFPTIPPGVLSGFPTIPLDMSGFPVVPPGVLLLLLDHPPQRAQEVRSRGDEVILTSSAEMCLL